MQNSVFIIVGAAAVIILQGLTILITKYFVKNIKSDIEGLKHLLNKPHNEDCKCSQSEDIPAAEKVRPFDFIKDYEAAYLLNYIKQEHPQTIALVLSYLEPNKAAFIFAELPHFLQSEVIRRISEMRRVNPKMVSVIEHVLKRHFERFESGNYLNTGGIDSAVEILHLTDRGTEAIIIKALEEEDPELAEEIKRRMLL